MMDCRCPGCGTLVDSHLSTYGYIQCPGCSERYWIPAEVFVSAPFSGNTVDGIRILGAYFDDLIGYSVLTRDPTGQYVIGRKYDPFRRFWLGGDFFDDLQSAMANLNGTRRIGGVA